MTRDNLWALLQSAVPGIRRVARADVFEPAVIYAETLTPQGSHRVYQYSLNIAVPLERMPEELQDDARVIALRKMCGENGIAWQHTLSANDELGCPVYECMITVQNLKED